jgi:hypothetical protein
MKSLKPRTPTLEPGSGVQLSKANLRLAASRDGEEDMSFLAGVENTTARGARAKYDRSK